MKTLSRKLLWTSLSAALLALAPACDNDEPEADECGEPLYGGDATDEAWRSLVDAKDKATASAEAVTLESPTEGQAYIGTDAPPTWRWTSPIASLTPGAAPLTPSPQVRPRDEGRSVLAWLGNLILPSAEAHLPPFTGDIYWVQVTVPGRTCPVEMLTSNLEWQLDAATWDTLRGAIGQDLSIQVTSAYLVENRLREGPYKLATPRTVHMVGAR